MSNTPKEVIKLIEDNAAQKSPYLDLGCTGIDHVPQELLRLKDHLCGLNLSAFPWSKDEVPVLLKKGRRKSGMIDLSGLELLADFPMLKRLDICDRYLMDEQILPINHLVQIEELDLSDNYLKLEIDDTLRGLNRLVRLDISKNRTSAKGSESLSKLISLHTLNISDNQLGTECAESLSKLTGLQSLDVSYNGLGKEGAESLTKLVGLHTLTISYNGLGNEGAESLSKLVGLHTLTISYNGLGNECAESLSKLVSLHTLNISDNQLGNEGAESLSKLVGLHTLNISDNQLGTESAETLCKLTGLQSLDVNWNGLGTEGAESLSKLVGLHTLNIKGNGIGTEGAESLSKFTGLQSLDVSFNGLGNEGAESLSKLVGLHTMHIGGNRIGKEGAESLSKLVSLHTLNISDNQLGNECAESLSKLTGLQSLDVSYNGIGTEGAESLTKLVGLHTLTISYNGLGNEGAESLSKLVGLHTMRIAGNRIGKEGAECLSKLTGLQTLDVSYNELGNEGAESLSKLVGLHTLNISDNQLGTECAETLSKLTGLQYLDVNWNALGTEGAEYLSKLTGLQSLDVSFNGLGNDGAKFLTKFRFLRHLDISYNSIDDSSVFKKFIETPYFQYDNNPTRDVPEAILNSGNRRDLINWWKELENPENTGKNNWIKLQITGNGDVGKTSLVDAIKFGICSKEHSSSHGVLLDQVMIEQGTDKVQVQINDFGGQELFHGTHRLFLSTNSVQMLVFDKATEERARSGQTREDRIKGDIKIYDHPLFYWRDQLEKRTDRSSWIVVQNKCLPDELIDTVWSKEIEEISHRFVRVSATAPYHIDVLKQTIVDAARSVREFGMIMPISWMKVRQFFIDNQKKEEPERQRLISNEEFEKLCLENGVSKEAISSLRLLLHSNGLIYQHKELLGDQIIADLRWALKAIYTPLDRNSGFFESLLDQRGKSQVFDLFKAFGNEYSESQKWLFLNFMQSCGICFPHKDDRYREKDQQAIYVFPNFLPDEATETINLSWNSNPEAARTATMNDLSYGMGHIQTVLSKIGTKTETRYLWKFGCLLKDGSGMAKITFNMPGKLVVELKGVLGQELSAYYWKVLVQEIIRDTYKKASLKSPEWEELLRSGIVPKTLQEREPNSKSMPAVQEPNDVIQSRIPLLVCSYAKEDIEYVKELSKHLDPLKDEGKIAFWYDLNLDGREDWDEELMQKFENAEGYTIFTSPDYVNSSQKRYIHTKEIPCMKRRHDNFKIPVYLIVAAKSDLQEVLRSFLSFKKGEPIPDNRSQRAAFFYDFVKEWIKGKFLIEKSYD